MYNDVYKDMREVHNIFINKMKTVFTMRRAISFNF
jgi:hypothetical protein